MLTARGEAHVRRLAAIYAILDETHVVEPVHLSAASALWDYCAASIRFIFGDKTGDPVADKIVDEVRRRGELSQAQITLELFNRNVSAARIAQAVELLLDAQAIVATDRLTRGRTATVYKLGGPHR